MCLGPITGEKIGFQAIWSFINIEWMDGWMDRQVVGSGRREKESRMTPKITHVN